MPHGNRPPLRGQYDQEVNMPNLLDHLFQLAAQQPARNTTTVDLAMTGNQITGNDITQNNLVTYGVGTLYYHPPHQAGGIFHFPAYFASQTDGITQYFSNRKFGGGPLGGTNPFLIAHYPQPQRRGTKQEHRAVSAGLNDGAQQGAISKGAQRGPVCCSLRNRGSVPGGGDALALAIRLCLPGLRRGASQLHQDPGPLPVYRLSTADIRDRRNDFRGDQGAAVHVVSRHVPPHSEQRRHLQH